MMRVLVSVRSVAEAEVVAHGGADFIDLKEPGSGALGGLPVETIRAVVGALRASNRTLPISATIGDLPMHALDTIRARVAAVAACGVDYVKVGIERDPAASAVLDALAECDAAIVPVFIADRGLDAALAAQALALGFPGVMADTADKRSGSLFDVADEATLRAFVAAAQQARVMVGLAGALRLAHLDRLAALAPDFAGFRSAVCAGPRAGALDPARLQALLQAVRRAAGAARPGQSTGARPSPSSSARMRASSLP